MSFTVRLMVILSFCLPVFSYADYSGNQGVRDFIADMGKKHQFDENLVRYAYMEDCDISWRVAQDGPLFYQPKAQLAHNNSPLARDAAVANRAMFVRNYRYLYFKNTYPKNKLLLLAHWWTLFGLFVYALLARDKDSIKGYAQALWVHK